MRKNPLIWIDRSVEILIFTLFVAMVMVGGLQVFNRFILNQSLSWSEEFQKYAHIWIIFLTIPVGYNRASHIGMQLLVDKFPKPLRKTLIYINDLLWLVLGASVVVFTFHIMQVAQFQTSSSLRLRMDYVYFGLVLGGGYLILSALRKIIGRLRGGAAEVDLSRSSDSLE